MFYIINNLKIKGFSSFSDFISRAYFSCTYFSHLLSELQDSDSENLLMEIRSKTLDETLEKLRNIFMPTTETFYLRCLDDPEILAHIDSNFEPPTKEPLDNVRLFPDKIHLNQINIYCIL